AGERFYTAAEARNGAMAENLLKHIGVQADSPKAEKVRPPYANLSSANPIPANPPFVNPPVVLVTGGFHTAAIAHSLKGHGISFVVVTPQVDRLEADELYVRAMTEPPHETVMALDAWNHAGRKLIRSLSNDVGDAFTGSWQNARVFSAIRSARHFVSKLG